MADIATVLSSTILNLQNDSGSQSYTFSMTPIPWRDVECNIPFKVFETNKISTVNGNALIVKMKKRDDTIIKACIVNFNTSEQTGSHWVCYFKDGMNQRIYFDSFGQFPHLYGNTDFRIQIINKNTRQVTR